MKKAKKKIGDILVENGLTTWEQIQAAYILQGTKKKKLGQLLVEQGHVTEDEIADALSKQFSLPLVDWTTFTVNKELLPLVPKEMAKKRLVFPIAMQKQKLLLAMADPLDLATIDYVTFRNGLSVTVAVSTETRILDAIEKYYGSWDLLGNMLALGDVSDYEDVEFVKETPDELDEANAESLIKLSEAAPVVKLVTTILVDAVKSGASDVHIEPTDKYVLVRYRIDGALRDVLKYPQNLHAPVISRVKIISRLDITTRMLPQDGRSTLRVDGRNVDLRVSTLPSVTGEAIVIRLLDHATRVMTMDKLGMPDRSLSLFSDLISRPQGMILITGPTGSGKTTTLYAILQQLRSETDNIVSIEDPVEYKIPGIRQVQVNEATRLTFPVALRSILRQDPDKIMVGEIRDLETAEIAMRAAVTGHLVFSTVHTNDTVSSVVRLLDIGIPHYLINTALAGVMAQRLVRRICPDCKTQTDPPEEILTNDYPPLDTCFKGIGCDTCQFTGYKGQVGVFELLRISSALKESIAGFSTEDDLWAVAKKDGTMTLFEDAWEKVKEGTTTIDEVTAKVHHALFEKQTKSKIKPLLFDRKADRTETQA